MKKKLYTKTKAAMDASIKGVQLALKGLREYYARDKAHAADEGDGAGVIGLLEVVESHVFKGLIEMTSTEEMHKEPRIRRQKTTKLKGQLKSKTSRSCRAIS